MISNGAVAKKGRPRAGVVPSRMRVLSFLEPPNGAYRPQTASGAKPALAVRAVPEDPAPFPKTLTTLHWPKRPTWTSRVEVLDRTGLSTPEIFLRLAKATGHDAIVVDGATGGPVRLTDLGAAMLLARRRVGPTVIVTDATWSRGTSLLEGLARRAGLRGIDSPRVVYCVLSSEEQRVFPRTWNVDSARVVFTPFYFTIDREDIAQPTSEEGGIFAGGDALRDYEPLLQAARSLAVPVTIAARSLTGRHDLPANVCAGYLPRARFLERMRAASVVVVALARATERSAGQQSYLNAMALGKLVVVPDAMGVRDYITPGRTGLIVPPGNARALSEALRWALEPTNRLAVREMAARGREEALTRFTPEHYVECVLRIVERFARRHR